MRVLMKLICLECQIWQLSGHNVFVNTCYSHKSRIAEIRVPRFGSRLLYQNIRLLSLVYLIICS